jgi:NTE family protein
MVAALQAAGESLSRLEQLAQNIDYSKFADPTLLARIPIVGPALTLVATTGSIGATTWRTCSPGCSVTLRVRTFGDLRTGEQAQQHAENRNCGRLARKPTSVGGTRKPPMPDPLRMWPRSPR